MRSMKSFIFVTIALTMWLYEGAVAQTSEVGISDDEVKLVVRDVVRLWRGEGDRTEVRTDYLRIIEPVMQNDSEGIGKRLRALGTDDALSPLEKRICAIVAQRLSSPRQFEIVESYLKSPLRPRTLDPLFGQAQYADPNTDRDRIIFGMRIIPLELMARKYREAVNRHRDIYENIIRATESFDAAAGHIADDTEVLRKMIVKYKDDLRLAAIPLRRDTKDLNLVLVAAQPLTGPSKGIIDAMPLPELDETYLLAWEEAMLCAQFDKTTVHELVTIVANFKNEASVPSFATVIRVRMRDLGANRVSARKLLFWHTEPVVGKALPCLLRKPSLASAREITEILEMNVQGGEAIVERLVSAISNADIWRQWLETQSTVEGDAGDVARRLQALIANTESKSP